MKTRFDLIELARTLEKSAEDLIRIAADGHYVIHVIADNWPGKLEAGDANNPDIKVDGPVDLLPEDLLKALNADSTSVNRVRLRDGRMAVLKKTQEVERGVHFVTIEESDRLSALFHLHRVTRDEKLPGYFDASHPGFSETLDAAVQAWLALFDGGGFVEGQPSREQIEKWLIRNFEGLSANARDAIVTVVNPNRFKRGGHSEKISE